MKDEPDSEGPDPERRAKPFNYSVVVGIVFVLVIAVAAINALRTTDSGTVGLGDVLLGEKVKPFAVPIATSHLEGDANVDPKQACLVEGRGVLRICDYFDRPLVMSWWFTKGASGCIAQQDIFDDVAAKYKDRAGFVSINVRDSRDRLRQLIEEHDWKVKVGHDADGAASNIYRIGGCPTFLFVRPGGVLEHAEIGDRSFEELDSQVRSFLNSDGKKVKTG